MSGLAAIMLAVLAPTPAEQATFTICGSARRVTCVVDGDTFWLHRVKYRIADIDAPEVSQPQCQAEAEAAGRATSRLLALLNAGPFELQTQGLDRYGRTLVTVWRGNRSLGMTLVQEGHARRWGDRKGWC